MDLESLLDSFTQACLEVFGGERVEGVVLHGSAVKGGGIPGFSDVDFMVFLSPDSFDEQGNVSDEAAFAIQERIGPLPWREAGYLYPQAYFYNARSLPEWWTGPAPGAYRVLWGTLPSEAEPTAELLRAIEARYLQGVLPGRVTAMVQNFADSDDASLPRRVRLLGTDVTPAVFAVLTSDAEDVLALWAQTKWEALARLQARYPDDAGPPLARRFYENVRLLYGQEFDADLGRETFRIGVAFLRWAAPKAPPAT